MTPVDPEVIRQCEEQHGACYATHAGYSDKVRRDASKYGRVPGNWPWDRRWWKPKDRRRDLVRAAALIVAEIERLDRLAEKEATA